MKDGRQHCTAQVVCPPECWQTWHGRGTPPCLYWAQQRRQLLGHIKRLMTISEYHGHPKESAALAAIKIGRMIQRYQPYIWFADVEPLTRPKDDPQRIQPANLEKEGNMDLYDEVDSERKTAIYIGEGWIKRETDKAMLVSFDKVHAEEWIPKSQLVDPPDETAIEGPITITQWLAEQKGWGEDEFV